MIIASRDIDDFVARSDDLGGPGHPACDAYWAEAEFTIDTVVDQTLNPFGDAYVAQQLAVYRELSGRDLDQLVNEHTELDIDLHVDAVNPYDHGSPGGLSTHVERLSRAVRLTMPPRGGRALDMGCGWGLSAEVLAYAGLSVTAVDVNEDFVNLVNRRAARSGYDITAVHGTFDEFETDLRFDLIVFYECLHHAVRPWTVLRRMADLLAPGGSVVLAGEPINDTWWESWGLRLDPMSVYCIRKFGWLESGWSEKFLRRAFRRGGLRPRVVDSDDEEIGQTVIGTLRSISTTPATEIMSDWHHSGWFQDGDFLVSSGDNGLSLPFPEKARRAHLDVRSFRNQDLTIQVMVGDTVVGSQVLPPGDGGVLIDRDAADGRVVRIVSDVWSPSAELDTADTRLIGFHLAGVTFY
jgi:2-polyprenyl-3-methyl-5-hydroxy-6-metoxy-1,4-benzoquinol methylase